MKICHEPVFLDYILNHLLLPEDAVVADLTLGEGGHTEAFLNLEKKVYGFDRDANIIKKAHKRLETLKHYSNFIPVNENYSNAEKVLINERIDFGLFDLGISKFHYMESKRGFTFMYDEPLDMRLNDGDNQKSASDVVNEYSEEQLANLFYQYGEEHLSRTCAKLITNFRKETLIKTTLQLVNIIKEAYKIRKVSTRINPATKVFQALRIEVNREFDHITEGILAVAKSLNSGGRLAVITYHSLEDRIVKNLFNDIGKRNDTYNKYRETPEPKEFYQFTPKVIKPSFKEIKANVSARSAKMRVLGRY